ncbi:hypothetical protein [Alienimonas sp. DA493]|uniref:hypothetical protein n=1 Tax=Alienimonas sp. DA493 TaxID=3373605 RepID=UPI0037543321
MAESLTPAETLAAALAAPKRSKRDGVEMEEHSLPDLIEAAKYVAQLKLAAGSRRRPPIRLQKMRPPGAV